MRWHGHVDGQVWLKFSWHLNAEVLLHENKGSSLFSVEPRDHNSQSERGVCLNSLSPPAATGASTAGRKGRGRGEGQNRQCHSSHRALLGRIKPVFESLQWIYALPLTLNPTAIELSRNSETHKGAKYPVSFEFLSFGFNPITFLRFAILNSMTVGTGTLRSRTPPQSSRLFKQALSSSTRCERGTARTPSTRGDV